MIPVTVLKELKCVFQRSIFVYVLLFLLLGNFIHSRYLIHQRLGFLKGIYLQGNYENNSDGLLYFEQKIRLEPDNATAYAGLGVCYFNLKDYDRAYESYQKAIKLAPYLKVLRQHLSIIEQARAAQTKSN